MCVSPHVGGACTCPMLVLPHVGGALEVSSVCFTTRWRCLGGVPCVFYQTLEVRGSALEVPWRFLQRLPCRFWYTLEVFPVWAI